MEILLIISSYLIGSLSSSIIVCKILRLPDPRTTGSKNAGATNISRFASKKVTFVVLFADILKGVIAIAIAEYFLLETLFINIISIAVVLGHIFPIFFNFRGGKGIATFFGVLIILSPTLSIIALISWILVILLFKYSSLASIVSTIVVAIFSYFISYDNFIGLTILSLLLIIKHQENIVRLIKGKENKIGNKNKVS